MRKNLLALVVLAGLPLAAAPAFAAGVVTPPVATGDTTVAADPSDPTTVGDTGTGTLTITGTIYGTSSLEVGSQFGSNGTVSQIGGTVNDDAIIGDAGTGSYDNNNGTHNVSGNLILGNQSTGSGTYTIEGNGASTNVTFVPGGDGTGNPNGALIVGNAGTGTFTQGTDATDNGNQVNVAGDLALGLKSDSQGTYTLNSGTLTIGGLAVIGAASTNANLFTQNGGTFNVTGANAGNGDYVTVSPTAFAGGAGNLYIGGESITDNGTGTYTLTGGNLSVVNSIYVGFSGTGTVNQSSGAVTANYVDLGGCGGCNGGNAAGFYNLTGDGTLTTNAETVGDVGHGEFLQDGASTVNTVNGLLAIGNAQTATPDVVNTGSYDRSGLYTLNNGTLNTQNTDVGYVGTGTFIQNGGTHNVSNALDIGVQNTPLSGALGSGTPSSPVFGGPALGTYTMNGGTLSVVGDPTQNNFAGPYPFITGGTGIIVGDAGNGVFNQFGASTVTTGTPQVPNTSAGTEGDLVIGAQGPGTEVAGSTGTSQGTYNLGQTGQGAAPSLTVNGSIIIGRDAGSNGATVPGASPTNPNLVIQGDGTQLSVFYNGGGITNANPLSSDILVGLSGNGAVTQTDNSTVYMDGDLDIGINQGAVGSYNLNATSNGANLQVGNFLNIGGVGEFVNCCSPQTTATGGTGYFTQTSGDVTVVQDVDIGNNGGTGTYAMSGGTLAVSGFLNLGNSGGTGTFNLSDGAVTVSATTYLGSGGTGTVTQTGGTFETGYLDIGIDNTTGNSFTLSNGTVTVDQDLVVGNFAGSGGSFTQISGTVNVNSGGFGVYINNGTYDLQFGNFNVANSVTLGDVAGGASFTQEGGTAVLGNNLIIGNQAGVTGSYTMTDGILTVGNNPANAGSGNYGSPQNSLVLGNLGTGTFTQNGGVVNIGGDTTASSLNPVVQDLVLGQDIGSTGTYNMTNGTLNVYGNASFGNSSIEVGFINGAGTGGGSGLFVQTGGTVNTYGVLGVAIGDNATAITGSAEYDISNGNLNINQNPTVATNSFDSNSTGDLFVAAHDNGSLVQTGGTVAVAGDAFVGLAGGASGTWTINDSAGNGEPTVTVGGDVYVGGASILGTTGTGEVDQSAGSVTVSGNMFVGSGPSSTGTYNLSDPNNVGTQLTVNNTLTIGDSGTGTFNQTAGYTIVNNELHIGGGTGSTGTYLLSGGSLTVGENVYIGLNGTGTMTVSNQANVTVDNVLTLGGPSPGETGTGTLTVTGSGTSWTNMGQTQVGGYATGTLNILSGGYFESHTGGSGSGTAAAIGVETGSTGTVLVDGSGSQWNIADGALRVGVGSTGSGNGVQGNLVTISNGGAVIDYGGNGGGGAPTDDGAAASVGWKAGSVGTVNVTTGGIWTNNGDLVIGDAGTGTVSVDGATGSSVSVANNLILGNLNSGDGTLNLANGGALSFAGSAQFIVGNAGTGVVNQTDGDLNLNTAGVSLDIGALGGSHGTYNLTGGSLEDDIIVGDAGTGTFNNTGMTHTVTGNLNIGNQSTGNGTYNLTAGGTTTVSGTTVVGQAGTGTFLNDASTHNTETMIIAAAGGSSGLYTLKDDGILNIGQAGNASFLDIGEHGTGKFTQTGGTTTITGALDIGRCAGAGCLDPVLDTDTGRGVGTLDLSSGSISVLFDPTTPTNPPGGYGGFMVVGDAGTGTVNQSGNATLTANEIDVGRSDGGIGTYNLSGTASVTLTAAGPGGPGGGLYVGAGGGVSGNGLFTQTDTTKVSAVSVTIGNNTGSVGEYDLSGSGTLTVGGELYVGAAGSGTMNQSGGTVTAATLSIGNNAGGIGRYNLSGGKLTIAGETYLAGDNPSQGTIVQTGGTASLGGNLWVGYATNGTGSYDLNSNDGPASLTIAGNLDLGRVANSSGEFDLNLLGGSATVTFSTPGSSLTVGDSGIGVFDQGGGDLDLKGQGVTLNIGLNVGSNGHYTLTGGSLEDDVIVGDAGTGTFTNMGGTHTVSGNLIVGNQVTSTGTYTLGGTGTLTLSDANAQIILGNANNGTNAASGSFSFNVNPGDTGAITFAKSGDAIIVGNNGNGVFSQGGGDLNLTGAGATIDIAANAGSFGQYNMSGGTLEAPTLTVGDGGSGQFNQSGGSVTVGTNVVSGNLTVGNQTNSAGVYSIGGAANPSLTVWGDAAVGSGGTGSFSMGDGATVDIKGSMTVGGAVSGGAAIEGGSLTIGKNWTIDSTGSAKIEDDGTVGASVSVGGMLTNSGELALGLHLVPTPASLTVSGGFQNNNSFNFVTGTLTADVTNGSATNHTAFITTQNGSTSVATLNGNVDNFALLNVSSSGVGASPTWTQTGNFTNEVGGTFTVIGSKVTINGTGTALTNSGTVSFTQDVNGPTAPISIVAITGGVTNNATGTITATDAKVTVAGNVDNFGTVTINQGGVNVASNVTVTGTVTNETGAHLNVANSALTVNGNTTNSGTVSLTSATVNWNGTFHNNGAYLSDPSTSTFIDLDIGATGYLTGSTGDKFIVTGDFTNASTQNTLWNTNNATLEFSTGSSTSHVFDLTGLDDGPVASGFTDNFAWGLLDIDGGNSIDLASVGTNALYVSMLEGLIFAGNEVTNILGNGFNIYYDPNQDPGLGDLTYALADGGFLCPIGASTCTVSTSPPPPPGVPEPSSFALLGAGLAGLGLFWRRRRRPAASAPH